MRPFIYAYLKETKKGILNDAKAAYLINNLAEYVASKNRYVNLKREYKE